jgi:branched-chain amino acid aminotransferase
MSHIILNGETVQAQNARVSVQDRGFRFGDGLFETMGVADGIPYRFDWHMRRLTAGLDAIRIAFPVDTLEAQCRELLRLNGVEDGLLRIQITRGTGSKGYLPDSPRPTCLIETLPAPTLPNAAVTLFLSSYRKISPAALPVRYKITQGLNSTLARMEADDHDCFDALLINDRGELCETSSGNIFWLKNDTLYTPALSCGVLEGCLRAALSELSPYKLVEARASVETLAGAAAVMITNAAWKILPVNALKPLNLSWQSEEEVLKLAAILTEDVRRRGERERQRWHSGIA